MGTDARLHWDAQDQVIHATFTEELLTLLLAKLANLIRYGGIWMTPSAPSGTTPTTRWWARGSLW
jgi:hypothetical protein